MTTTNDETPLKAHSRSWSSWATRRCCSTPAPRSPRSSWSTASANCPIRTPRSRKTRTQATPACSKGLLFSFDAMVSESSGISRYGTARSLPRSFPGIFLADTQYFCQGSSATSQECGALSCRSWHTCSWRSPTSSESQSLAWPFS